MSIISRIKADQIAARKARNTCCATTLTTLLGEAIRIGKDDGDRETTDDEVIRVVKKFIKNIDFTQEQSNELDSSLVEEKATLSVYLPQQLSEEELNTMISAIIKTQKLSGMRGVGAIMKELNGKFSGQFNGKDASSIARNLLS